MYVNPVVQAARERKVEQVIAATGCTRDEAISYLFADEWFVADAVMSYRVDCEIRAHRDQRIETRTL
jgi:hypothetical protein